MQLNSPSHFKMEEHLLQKVLRSEELEAVFTFDATVLVMSSVVLKK